MGPLRHVEVVAGVIRDARGRILLARRTEGRDLAGLWEFPGGKHEPGESAEAALARELHEELGIDVDIGAPLITRAAALSRQAPAPGRAHDRRVARHRARPRRARRWSGCRRTSSPSYAMPPADRPGGRRAAATAALPGHAASRRRATRRWLGALERALAAGVRRVQLRAPGLRRRHAGARWSRARSHAAGAAGAEVLVNGDVDAGERARHRPASARRRNCASSTQRPVPTGLPLGRVLPRRRRAAGARKPSAATSPCSVRCKPTPSHPGVEGIGWEGFAALRESVSLPIYAIGGLATGRRRAGARARCAGYRRDPRPVAGRLSEAAVPRAGSADVRRPARGNDGPAPPRARPAPRSARR